MILLLGGYGEVGQCIAHLILKQTESGIVIAGRRKEKAEEFAEKLNQEFQGNRANACYADATNLQSLLKAFQNINLVLVLTTTPESLKQIGKAALVSGCDYMDILVSETSVRDLSELATSIEERKKVFITQGGFHPGLPSLFVRYAASYFDRYDKASIAMAMNARFKTAEQAKEIIPMITDFQEEIFVDGNWKKASYKDSITVEMGDHFGKMNLYPFKMIEMRQVVEKLNLKEAGVYISGFNWFVDYIVMPIIYIAEKVKKGFATHFLLKLFVWGVNTFSSPTQGVVFMNLAEGMKDGKKITLRIHSELDDAYQFTAIAVVSCLKQYLDGNLPTGLSMMGHAVDDKRFFEDLKKMGVKISIETGT